MLILLTGCSCNYELSIQNNKIYETLKINGVTSNIPVNADLINISNSNYIKTVENDIVTYNSNYLLDNYKKSTLLTCFDSYNIQSTENTYTIRTGKKFKCYPYQYSDFDVVTYDQLEIKINTNHKVINHNATKVEIISAIASKISSGICIISPTSLNAVFIIKGVEIFFEKFSS